MAITLNQLTHQPSSRATIVGHRIHVVQPPSAADAAATASGDPMALANITLRHDSGRQTDFTRAFQINSDRRRSLAAESLDNACFGEIGCIGLDAIAQSWPRRGSGW